MNSLRVLAVSCLLVASAGAERAVSQSLGHYHQPGTVLQFTGHGFGAGYHAPMIRPTHCHMPRQQRYVHVRGCGMCAPLPMQSFPTCGGASCHTQLDQLLKQDEYELPPVTPTEIDPLTAVDDQLLEPPRIPMLPEP